MKNTAERMKFLIAGVYLSCSIMANTTSPHILGTSANLLGFCLFVLTSLHISDQTENQILDECTSVIAVLLTASCLFSFISLRTRSARREQRYETIAEYIFAIALLGILSVILLITLNFFEIS